MSKIVLILLAALRAALCAEFDDYCKAAASSTPCKTQCQRDHESCGPKNFYIYKHLTMSERQYVQDGHNTFRNKLAGGYFRRMGLTAAANMQVLSVDKELEWLSACLIFRCKNELEEESSRKTMEAEAYGQNIYEEIGEDIGETFLNRSMTSWFTSFNKREMKNISNTLLTSYTRTNRPMAEFTQAGWATTALFGCAKYKYQSDSKTVLHFFCNYHPAGNVPGEKLYETGKPVSNCPEGSKKNSRFPNLCGYPRDIQFDYYEGAVDFDPEGTLVLKAEIEAKNRRTYAKTKDDGGKVIGGHWGEEEEDSGARADDLENRGSGGVRRAGFGGRIVGVLEIIVFCLVVFF